MATSGVAFRQQFPQWIRGLARIEGEEIVLDEGRAETYYIHGPEALLFDLAALVPSRPDFKTQDAVRFARRHGLLWHGPESVGSGECRESLEAWWYAAARLSVIIRLYEKLMQGVEEGSAAPVRSLGYNFARVPGSQQWSDDEYDLRVASMLVASAISGQLVDCSHAIAAACGFVGENGGTLAGPGIFMYDIHPANLEFAAYIHLAQLVVARAEVKDCLGCGRPFTPTSGKQKYHSPSCASTSRGRKFREKRSSGKV